MTRSPQRMKKRLRKEVSLLGKAQSNLTKVVVMWKAQKWGRAVRKVGKVVRKYMRRVKTLMAQM